jgi:hypothetical protein
MFSRKISLPIVTLIRSLRRSGAMLRRRAVMRRPAIEKPRSSSHEVAGIEYDLEAVALLAPLVVRSPSAGFVVWNRR